MTQKILVVLLLTGLATGLHAQVMYRAYQAGIASYSRELGKWVYGDPRPADIIFILQHKVMVANDDKHSTYILGDVIQNEVTTEHAWFSWKTTDDDGTTCILKIMVEYLAPYRIQIAVIYGSSCYYYDVKQIPK